MNLNITPFGWITIIIMGIIIIVLLHELYKILTMSSKEEALKDLGIEND
jgi:hypothetical protein